MDKAGIDKALVFAGRINSITTQEVIDEIAPYKDRLFAIGSVSQGINTIYMEGYGDQVTGWLESGTVRGLKFYPGYEYFYPADEWLRPYLQWAARYNRPVIFHSGDTFSAVHKSKLKYALPLHIDDLATELPELKIVIAHMGYPWQREAAEVVYKNKNVYADCSGFVYGEFDDKQTEHFKQVWKEFAQIAGGHEKILFGTDWPISDQRSYSEVVREIVRLDNEALLHGTAALLFGI
jgi:hypothetical protein